MGKKTQVHLIIKENERKATLSPTIRHKGVILDRNPNYCEQNMLYNEN